MPTLIIFGGLPGTGKSTIARELARTIGGVLLRIDTIEQAMRNAGHFVVGDEGYRVAYAVAGDNLRLGRTVVADSVNPLAITREAWRTIARKAQVASLEVEVVCSDLDEYQRRVETRVSYIEGLVLPSWQKVLEREYEAWDQEHLVVDTAEMTVEQCVKVIDEALRR